MKKFNYKNCIREIEKEKYPESSKNNLQPAMNNLINSELEIAIQIIKDNIKEDDIACPHLKDIQKEYDRSRKSKNK